ncbi:MAG: hypothetical protein IOD12_09870 [Silvanigrellales bacterium]|jgi:hypothetical protein|nr:hypothetical protein [Silvanigrellales bacterium]
MKTLLALAASASLTLLSLPAQAQSVVDSVGSDVSVLKAYLTGLNVGTTRTSGASISLNVENCAKLGNDGLHEMVNCNAEFRTLMEGIAGHMNYPLAADVLLQVETASRFSSYYCSLMEIQTVTPQAALPGLSGIGFSFQGTLKTTPGHELSQVNTVKLKDGRSAAVHAFLAPVGCWAGSVTSSSRRVYEFKPFALFNGMDGNAYRVWDAAQQNYGVSLGGVRGFDRSAELLAP